MKNICFVTGTRAEYGLLRPLMKLVQKDEQAKLQIIATGMHLCSKYGNTLQTIIDDGLKIDKTIDMLLTSNSRESIVKSMGLANIGFSQAFNELKPDLLIVLGDRFEILSAAQSALIMDIPIAHIHGGELTEGAFDDAIRHSITKMSHLHFTSTEEYKKRVIQLGESPDNVFNCGAPGIDSIKSLKLLSKKELEDSLGVKLFDKIFTITYHPETIAQVSPKTAIRELFDALEKHSDATQIITLPNCDPGSDELFGEIESYCKKHKHTKAFSSLGQLRYLSLLSHSSMVIGNSSSGIIEVPYFKIPTLNIGSRQDGRAVGETVIKCNADSKSIDQAIEKALTNDFLTKCQQSTPLYGDGSASKSIWNIVKSKDLSEILKKRFYNLNSSRN